MGNNMIAQCQWSNPEGYGLVDFLFWWFMVWNIVHFVILHVIFINQVYIERLLCLITSTIFYFQPNSISIKNDLESPSVHLENHNTDVLVTHDNTKRSPDQPQRPDHIMGHRGVYSLKDAVLRYRNPHYEPISDSEITFWEERIVVLLLTMGISTSCGTFSVCQKLNKSVLLSFDAWCTPLFILNCVLFYACGRSGCKSTCIKNGTSIPNNSIFFADRGSFL